VSLVAWAVRLEAKTSTNTRDNWKLEKRLDRMELRHEELDSKVMEKLSKIETIVANIQGQLIK